MSSTLDGQTGIRGLTTSGGVTENVTFGAGLVLRVLPIIELGERVSVDAATRGSAARA